MLNSPVANQDTSKQKTILLAEDDPIVALDLKTQFLSFGYALLGPFNRSSSAVEALKERRPNLAIVDYRLLDGVATALTEQLEKLSVPYIVVTNSTRKRIESDCRPEGIIEKPFKMSRLSEMAFDYL